MKKLELKNLAPYLPYLPYRLKIKLNHGVKDNILGFNKLKCNQIVEIRGLQII